MKLKLQARHLWEAVEYPDIVEYDEDRSALDAICSAVPEDMVPALATKGTAYDAWEAIKTLHRRRPCAEIHRSNSPGGVREHRAPPRRGH